MPQPYGAGSASKSNSLWMGVTSLPLGIVGLMLSWFPLVGFLLGGAGVGFGIAGIAQDSGRGMAIGGVVTGTIAMIIQVVITVAVVT